MGCGTGCLSQMKFSNGSYEKVDLTGEDDEVWDEFCLRCLCLSAFGPVGIEGKALAMEMWSSFCLEILDASNRGRFGSGEYPEIGIVFTFVPLDSIVSDILLSALEFPYSRWTLLLLLVGSGVNDSFFKLFP